MSIILLNLYNNHEKEEQIPILQIQQLLIFSYFLIICYSQPLLTIIMYLCIAPAAT